MHTVQISIYKNRRTCRVSTKSCSNFCCPKQICFICLCWSFCICNTSIVFSVSEIRPICLKLLIRNLWFFRSCWLWCFLNFQQPFQSGCCLVNLCLIHCNVFCNPISLIQCTCYFIRNLNLLIITCRLHIDHCTI